MKLDPLGTEIWSLPTFHGVQNLSTGPADSIYFLTGSELVKLDAAGTTEWTRPLGVVEPICGFPFNQQHFVHRLDVGPTGEAAVHGGSHVSVWDADGTPRWTRAVGTNDCQQGVAIDSNGVVHVNRLEPANFPGIAIDAFAPDGTLLPTTLFPISGTVGMLAVDAAGHVFASSAIDDHAFLDRRTSTNVQDFFDADLVSNVGYVDNGIAVAANGDFTWVHLVQRGEFTAGSVVKRFAANGVEVWSIVHPPFFDDPTSFAGQMHSVAIGPNGETVVVGKFQGFTVATSGGWIQVYTPN